MKTQRCRRSWVGLRAGSISVRRAELLITRLERPLTTSRCMSYWTHFDAADVASFRTKLEGKIILVGPLLPLEDRALQPVLLARWEQDKRDAPGLLVHAQAIRSIGSGLIHEVPSATIVVLTFLSTLLWFRTAAPGRAIILPAVLSAGVICLSFWLITHRWFLPVGAILCGLWAAACARLLFDAMERLQQRRFLRGALAGYVGPQIVQEVLSGRLAAGLGGRRALICVVFADIRGFTPRSESMSPEEVVDLAQSVLRGSH